MRKGISKGARAGACLAVVSVGLAACGAGASSSTEGAPAEAARAPIGGLGLPEMGDDVRALIGSARAAITHAEPTAETAALVKVPRWTGSFVHAGKTYDYDVLGGDPTAGGTTTIKTAYLPLTFVIDPDADAGDGGAPVVFDAESITQSVLGSPNFQDAHYATGDTQYQDAQQRASFWSTMQPDWHTLLGAPRMLPTATFHVPASKAKLYEFSGKPFAFVDYAFYGRQLEKLLPTLGVRADEMLIAMSYDVNLGQGIGGFHSPSHDFATGVPGLFIWSGWVDPVLEPGFSDALALSHEIGESFDDPTGTTRVPTWSFPTLPTHCQWNLEVGDPLEVLKHSAHTVTIGGVDYHPQNLVLLPWFSRQSPSPAFDGAYTFPNTRLVTVPSLPCEREAGADGG